MRTGKSSIPKTHEDATNFPETKEINDFEETRIRDTRPVDPETQERIPESLPLQLELGFQT